MECVILIRTRIECVCVHFSCASTPEENFQASSRAHCTRVLGAEHRCVDVAGKSARARIHAAAILCVYSHYYTQKHRERGQY
jgi:hypothetical protein